MHSSYDVKICVLGQVAVGKTSLVNAFARGTVESTVSTISPQEHRVQVRDRSGDTCYVQLWDTAGQERLQGLTSAYMRGAHGAVLLYDVSDPDSMLALKTVWIPFALENSAVLRRETIVVVGNKCDLGKDTEAVRAARAYCEVHGYDHLLARSTDPQEARAPFLACVNRIAEAKLAVSKRDGDIVRLADARTPPARPASNTCC